MTAGIAERRIRQIAQKSQNVGLGEHARTRMEEREIFDADVFRVLRDGSIKGEPERTAYGEWKCKMVKAIRGGRDVGVVTIILTGDSRLFVKTVEWEDMR
jgi:hypothetical protein